VIAAVSAVAALCATTILVSNDELSGSAASRSLLQLYTSGTETISMGPGGMMTSSSTFSMGYMNSFHKHISHAHHRIKQAASNLIAAAKHHLHGDEQQDTAKVTLDGYCGNATCSREEHCCSSCPPYCNPAKEFCIPKSNPCPMEQVSVKHNQEDDQAAKEGTQHDEGTQMNQEELNHQSKVHKGTQSKPDAEVAAITKKFEKHAKVAATTEEIEKHAKTDRMIHPPQPEGVAVKAHAQAPTGGWKKAHVTQACLWTVLGCTILGLLGLAAACVMRRRRAQLEQHYDIVTSMHAPMVGVDAKNQV